MFSFRRSVAPPARFPLKALGWLAVFVLAVPLRAQFVFNETFSHSTFDQSGWVVASSNGTYVPALTASSAGGNIDANGSGWLRMTNNQGSEATYARLTTPIPSASNNITVDLRYQMWTPNAAGADGFTISLRDASVTNFDVGAFGGSLGYAQKTTAAGGDTTHAGMAGGYFSVGVDAFGNFSNATEGRVGGIGSTPDAIAVRGPGSGTGTSYNGGTNNNYAYINGTTNLNQAPYNLGTINFTGANSRPVDTSTTNDREIVFNFTTSNILTVSMRFGSTGTLTQVFQADLTTLGVRPENLELVFTAGTGGSMQYTEIKGLSITTTGAPVGTIYYSNYSGDNKWGTGNNWGNATTPNIGVVPGNNANLVFSNHAFTAPAFQLTTAQNVDLGANRSAGSIQFDAPFNYTLQGSTLTLDSGQTNTPTAITVTSAAPGGAHTIQSDVVLNSDVNINTNTNTALNLSGNIAAGSHTLTLNNNGTTTIAGQITGSGTMTQTSASTGTTVISGNSASTYTGNIVVQSGTVRIGNDNVLNSATNVSLSTANSFGTLDLANHNQTLGGIDFVSGGSVQTGSGILTLAGNVNSQASATTATISGNLNLGATNRTFSIANGGAATDLAVSANVAGTGGVVKTGNGTLLLSGANTYTGPTNVSAGTVVAASNSALGTGPTTVSSSATLALQGGITLNSGNITASGAGFTGSNGAIDNRSGNNTLTSNVTLAGNTTVGAASGTQLTLAGTVGQSTASNLTAAGSGIVVLAGNNSYTGTTTINTGATLVAASNNALGSSGGVTTVASGGTLAFQGGVNYTSGETVNVAGTGASGRNGAIDNLTGTNTFAGNVALTGATTIGASTGTRLNLSGPISGTTNLAIGGTGTVALSGNNTYTGTTTVGSGATLIAGSNAALGTNGTTATATNVTSGGTLGFENGVTINFENLTINGTGVGGNGALSSVTGSNTVTNQVTLAGNATLAAAANSTLTLSSGITNGATAYGITKADTGTVVLAGSSNYGGSTNVTAGTLSIAGSGAVTTTSDITVTNGTFRIDNTLSNAGDRVRDAAPIALNDGRIEFIGNGTARTTETLGTVTASTGQSTIFLRTGAGQQADLTISNLARNEGATITFATDPSIALGSGAAGSPRVFLSQVAGAAPTGTLTAPVGLPGWILVNDSSGSANFAEYTGAYGTGNGVRALSTYYTGALGININDPTASVLLTASSPSGAYTLTRGSTTANTTDANLKITDAPLVSLMDNRTLRLNSGGLIKSGATATTISGTGELSTGSNGTLAVTVDNAGGRLTIESEIMDNGTTSLTKAGAGVLELKGVNTFTGTVNLNDGVLRIGAESGLGSTGVNRTINLNGGILNVTTGFTANTNKTWNIGPNTSGTFDIDSGQTLTFNGVDDLTSSTTSQFVKTGTGTLVLGASNTGFQGAALVNSGTLELRNANALGTNRTLTLAGGTLNLRADAATTFATNITVTADSTINADRISTGSNLTLGVGTVSLGSNVLTTNSGPGGNFYDMKLGAVTVTGNATLNPNTLNSDLTVGAISGTGSITKDGVANLTYTAASNYTGATTVKAGTLFTQGTDFLPTTTALTISDGATVNTGSFSQKIASLASNGAGNTATLNAGSGTLTVGDSTSTTFGGTITAGSFVKNGSGTLTLAGGSSNAITAFTLNDGTVIAAKSAGFATGSGNVTIGDGSGAPNSAVLRLGAANQIADTSVVTLASEGRLDLAGFSDTIASLAGSGTTTLGAGTLTINGTASTTYAGSISGTGGLIKNGTGTLALSGNSSYSGATAINAGVVQVSSSTALGTGAGGVSVTNGAALELLGNINVTGAALTLNGTGVSNGGALRNVSGDNTWRGAVTLGSASTITVNSGNLYLAGGIITGGNALTVAGTGNTQATGAITGTGGVTKEGIGALVLGASGNTYSGATTVNAGSVQINATGAGPGSSALNLAASGTTLNVNNYAASVGSLAGVAGSNVTLGSGALTAGANNASTVFSGVISGVGGSVTKVGTGTLTLNGNVANTFTGGLNVADGTVLLNKTAAVDATGTGALTIGDNSGAAASAIVQLGAADQINNGVAVSINSDGRLNLNNFNETIGSLAGSGTVTLGTGTLTTGANNTSTTFTGTITGSGGLVKQGTGTMTLGAATGYAGTATVNGGKLVLGANNAVSSTASLTINAGALQLGPSVSQTVAGLSAAAGTNVDIGAGSVLTVSGTAATSLLGTVTGSGSLVVTAGGNLSFGSNGGTVNFSAGTLSFGGTTKGGTPTTTLYLAGNVTIGTLNITGDTVLDFGYSASTTLNIGTLNIASGARVTVKNWVNLSDLFYANYFTGAVPDQRGNTPVPNNSSTQITFTGYTNNQTVWQGYDKQITPAPEPATYGAIFVGAALGFFGLRRWRRRRC